MILRSTRIVTPGGVIDGALALHDGLIVSVGDPAGAAAIGGEVVDAGERWVVPGFIDLHVHGGGGGQCNTADPHEVMTMAGFHARHGTTALLATTVSAPVAELEESCRAIADCVGRRGGAAVLGAHLEGPFISRARPGAMDPATFLDPDLDVFERLRAAGRGTVAMMTLAPELPGGLPLVQAAVRAGIVASLGHSDAGYEQAAAAVRAGAVSATHTFNAMPALHHREPGLLGAVLDLKDVSCELICDGIHVAPPACRLVHRAKGGAGVRLVTDAMQAAGMPDGEYRLGGARVTVSEGRAIIAGGGSIAGSTLTMDSAVANAVAFLGLSVPEAVVLASANPARLIGCADRKGALATGYDADAVVLDETLRACGTLVGGEWVHGPEFG